MERSNDKLCGKVRLESELISRPRYARKRRLTLLGVILAILVIIVTSWIIFVALSRHERSSSTSVSSDEDDADLQSNNFSTCADHFHDFGLWPVPPPDPKLRYDLEYGSAACWPSTGGVWIKRMSLVELDYLGINRFNNTNKSDNAVAENAFCSRLESLGASFYSLPEESVREEICYNDIVHCYEPEIRCDVEVGYPSGGGVWVLDQSSGPRWYPRIGSALNDYEYGYPDPYVDYYQPWTPVRPIALGNALTMDERCNVLKILGAKFCANLESCLASNMLTIGHGGA
ncbi:MAG: hypothetical protein M1814_000556 [Vezdaea aestivalis]|nr:MAG: hypothetical protein M1814_000556 [Vezdaea aestivalis]